MRVAKCSFWPGVYWASVLFLPGQDRTVREIEQDLYDNFVHEVMEARDAGDAIWKGIIRQGPHGKTEAMPRPEVVVSFSTGLNRKLGAHVEFSFRSVEEDRVRKALVASLKVLGGLRVRRGLFARWGGTVVNPLVTLAPLLAGLLLYWILWSFLREPEESTVEGVGIPSPEELKAMKDHFKELLRTMEHPGCKEIMVRGGDFSGFLRFLEEEETGWREGHLFRDASGLHYIEIYKRTDDDARLVRLYSEAAVLAHRKQNPK